MALEGICTFSNWFMYGGMGEWMDYNEPNSQQYSVGVFGLSAMLGTAILISWETLRDYFVSTRFYRRIVYNERVGNMLRDDNMRDYIEEMEREALLAEREATVWRIMNESRGIEDIGGRERTWEERNGRRGSSSTREKKYGALWHSKGHKCGEHGELSEVKEVRRRPEKGCAEVCCSICLDDLGEDRRHTIVTCCGHQYHKLCFEKVVRKEGDWYKCPNCRHERPVLIRTRFLKG